MPQALHVQRFPCPHCHSLRTIQTDTTAITETLCCPDCEGAYSQLYLRLDGANPLRTSPAMAIGVTSKLGEVSDLMRLLEAAESKKQLKESS